MTLTKEQISDIRNFISKKGIKYLDVQMEIIDHTASAVEERMTADQSLSFEQALKETHASFGIFGFGGLESSIINSLRSRYNRSFWNIFISFFKLKYIGLVLFAAFVVYKGQESINNDTTIVIALLVFTIFFMGVGILLSRGFKRNTKMLVYNVSFEYLSHIGMFVLVLNFMLRYVQDRIIYGIDVSVFLSTITVVLFVIYLIASFKTALKGIEEAEKLSAKYAQLNY